MWFQEAFHRIVIWDFIKQRLFEPHYSDVDPNVGNINAIV